MGSSPDVRLAAASWRPRAQNSLGRGRFGAFDFERKTIETLSMSMNDRVRLDDHYQWAASFQVFADGPALREGLTRHERTCGWRIPILPRTPSANSPLSRHAAIGV